MSLSLTCNAVCSLPIGWNGLTPEGVRDKSLAQIERYEVLLGNQRLPLAELFQVRGKPQDERWGLDGDFSRVHGIGTDMASGYIHIRGPAGRHVGSRMRGGEIQIEGDAGDFVGAEIHGGVIHVRGNAGNFVGAAYRGAPRGMAGGVILVDGDCGSEVGAAMRRGIIAIGGNAGELIGRNMRAGTVVVGGTCGPHAGVGVRRGTLVVLGPNRPALPNGYQFACTSRSTVLPLIMHDLKCRGFQCDDTLPSTMYDIYNGDFLAGGGGEIVVRHAS